MKTYLPYRVIFAGTREFRCVITMSHADSSAFGLCFRMVNGEEYNLRVSRFLTGFFSSLTASTRQYTKK